jgi:UDP-glucose 4-epimerase
VKYLPALRLSAIAILGVPACHALPGALPGGFKGADGFSIFGDDYETPDGTGVRDYIHVVDLAHGHLKAVGKLAKASGVHVWNLGTGRGHSVREVVATFEKVSGRAIPCKVGPRRPGDIAACWADPKKAETELGWKAVRSLEQMCEDSWKWQSGACPQQTLPESRRGNGSAPAR